MIEVDVNDAFKIKWINSGVTPTTIQARLYDVNETVVHSADMISSGNGHYYSITYVQTPGFYVAETYAIAGGNPYTRRSFVEAIVLEGD